MHYQEAIDWIHSREKFKVKPGLKRMEWMMEKLDHPERKMNAIHIAGTNGKGSTVSFLRHILEEQGCSVGTFTSPYIERFNERISVNGEPVNDQQLATLVRRVKPLAEELRKTPLGEPTEFEIITAMALIHFSEEDLDYVLMETGLGGRYDSTNIITPILSVITNIGHDHMNILGSTIEQIAEEKAGIIKQGVPVVTGVRQPESLDVILRKAADCRARVYTLNEDFQIEHIESTEEGEIFRYINDLFKPDAYVSSMRGSHQVENAALALQCVEVLHFMGEIFDRQLYGEGVTKTTWPARFETVRSSPLTIIDGAHNEEGTKALIETMKQHYAGRKITLVYAALEDKPVRKMIAQLEEIIDIAYMTTFDFPRAMAAEDLASFSNIRTTIAMPNVDEALEHASQQVGRSGVLLITGSLYFISNVRKYFEDEEVV